MLVSPHWITVLWGWAAGGRLMTAYNGVSPPWRVTDGVWDAVLKTSKRRRIRFRLRITELFFSCLSMFFWLVPFVNVYFSLSCPNGKCSLSVLDIPRLLFRQFPSSLTLIWSAFASPCLHEKQLFTSVKQTKRFTGKVYVSSEASHRVTSDPRALYSQSCEICSAC